MITLYHGVGVGGLPKWSQMITWGEGVTQMIANDHRGEGGLGGAEIWSRDHISDWIIYLEYLWWIEGCVYFFSLSICDDWNLHFLQSIWWVIVLSILSASPSWRGKNISPYVKSVKWPIITLLAQGGETILSNTFYNAWSVMGTNMGQDSWYQMDILAKSTLICYYILNKTRKKRKEEKSVRTFF